MNIPFINAIRSYLQGDGAAILPEMELVLFGLGILLIDFWIERKEKYRTGACGNYFQRFHDLEAPRSGRGTG